MNTITDDERALLFQFFGAYFHQDWDLEAETPAGVIALYIRDSSGDRIRQLRTAILRLIDCACENATQEERLLRDFGCYYLPSADGLTVNEWLQNILTDLSAAEGPLLNN